MNPVRRHLAAAHRARRDAELRCEVERREAAGPVGVDRIALHYARRDLERQERRVPPAASHAPSLTLVRRMPASRPAARRPRTRRASTASRAGPDDDSGSSEPGEPAGRPTDPLGAP